MLNNAIWCYNFYFSIVIARPIFLLPSFCVIFEPIIPLSSEFIVFGTFIFEITLVNIDISVVYSLFYRYSQVSVFDVQKIIRQPNKI